jgi:DNA-binding transcriptional regulator GbsR (MarR family)
MCWATADHFGEHQDTEMCRIIVEERKRREIDPTIAMLRQCAAEAAADSKTDPEVKARIESMTLFLEGMTSWYDQVKSLPKSTLITLIKMGARVAKFVAKVA